MADAFHISILPISAAADDPRPMFDRTFEEVSEALGKLPRMFVEPDGSFVWVSGGQPAWQIDGLLYDGAGRLWYMELKGRCPQEEFDQLLAALGWPARPVVVQLVREGALLTDEAFRRQIGWAE